MSARRSGLRRSLILTTTLAFAFMGASAATARMTLPAPPDCSTEGRGYPSRGDAEGATFLARSMEPFVNPNGYRAFRMKVLRVYAGDVASEVRVIMVCMDTRLRVGKTFLISSSDFRPRNGNDINRIRYTKDGAVAWKVRRDDSVHLVAQGRSVEPPRYLRKPDTLKEALAAVGID